MVDHSVPSDILDDLSSRFIINVPEEERKDLVRICFQIELAHWFYLDFYCTDENPKLRRCSMREFATHIFFHVPFLKPHVANIDNILEQWREYKQNVPTFGAIVLNEDLTKVLLVQSYWAKNSWSFPKGKVNEDEDPSHCAVREVLEETGFDISNLIDENEYIESVINEQLLRLYIICGVQKDTKFQPKTRKEIKNVEWFSLADLPNNKKDMTPKAKIGVGPNAFFMVIPFVRRMRRWIQEKHLREKNINTVRRHRHKSLGDVETVSKGKRQQQQQQQLLLLLPHSAQGDVLSFKDFKNFRQSNTSPARSRRSMYDNKNAVSKAAIKRNLFGEQNEDETSTALAKQLMDSPQSQQTCASLMDPAIQSVKCNEFNEKAKAFVNGIKVFPHREHQSAEISDGDMKVLLLGKAASILPTDLKTASSSFGATDYTARFLPTEDFRAQKHSTQLCSIIWEHFKFDKQAILNCL
ncbi:PREDICTED: m7GpppN-mRNA hydrolase [Dufourea novaeangliae]|uniref:m7GpppN-mRNA hydrolase n=1 Tax=Dufourea novaeangliae TaxID=178035 RepID=A0A154PN45_DUFNO|nr:PREDICTED: m7GpppN-mRNA hydrolase [Dufourea novaeangliae]KZC12640.1 m7GpppN-mRNA hydrolase [Dufourea novaeangliae]